MHQSFIENLKDQTNKFFALHWNKNLLGDAPQWSEVHTDFSKSIPSYDKQGVYAFIKEEEVTYIGVGTSRGSGRYKGNGLSARVMKYCRYIDKNTYGPVDERLKEAGAIMTIGFEQEHAYIANSLEIYLISRLHPKYNFIKVGM